MAAVGWSEFVVAATTLPGMGAGAMMTSMAVKVQPAMATMTERPVGEGGRVKQQLGVLVIAPSAAGQAMGGGAQSPCPPSWYVAHNQGRV